MNLKKLLLLTFILGCAGTAVVRNTGEDKNPQSAAVRVEASFFRGIGSGSGTHIGNGMILTNKHVCDMFPDAMDREVIDYKGDVYNVKRVLNSTDAVIDLCLIDIGDVDLPTASFEDANIDQMGKLAKIVGYPTGMYAQITGRVMGSTIFVIQDVLSFTPEFLTLLGAPSAPGVSGSGVYSENGKLIGVVNAGDSRITLFVPLAIVKEFVNVALRSDKNKR